MNNEERGRAIDRIINLYFPTLPPAGCVGTASAYDMYARSARSELEQLPELADISTGMKHNAGVVELADVVIASRPTTDPLEVIFGLPGARVGTGDYVQPFVAASTDGRPAVFYDGLSDWMQEQGARKHVNRFAAKYEPDYGFYRTPGGKPRVGEHHPSSSGIDDPEILKRYEAAREKATASTNTGDRTAKQD